MQQRIKHVIVIYQENWSFDALYANYPGANGSHAAQQQLQWGSIDANSNCSSTLSYVAMTTLTQPPLLGATNNQGPWPCGPNWVKSGVSSYVNAGGSSPDPLAGSGYTTAQPYTLLTPTNALTGDITHVFWHQQLQIDNGVLEPSNGTMDKFVAYSSNPGYVLSQYDATNLPEGKIAQHYTMLDNMYHSAFGGSFLNHQWLICACTPSWNQALPTSNTTTFESYFNPTTKSFNDGSLTLMPTPQTSPGPSGGPYYVVNTTQTANNPHSATTSADQLLAPISGVKTIGDELTDASPSISWKWYSGGWYNAVASAATAGTCNSPPTPGAQTNPTGIGMCFQFHHQPFNYYARWGTTGTPPQCSTTPTQHLCDETDFLSDLTGPNLPSVVFVKPQGPNNEHPNYSALLLGQQHVQSLVAAICKSNYWNNSIIIITYDENGGRWDHVTPPHIDQWGPGTRVPGIVISPYARAGVVDHTQYETVSILSLIEKLFNLPALPTSSSGRDATANPFLNALNFNQLPLACQSS